MFTLTDVAIDGLWLLGLAGAFATLSYSDWYRGLQGWSWARTWDRPRFLAPFNLSLSVFALGMALNHATARDGVSWWQTAGWLLVALLCAAQVLSNWQLARARGWNSRGNENDDAEGAEEVHGA